MKRLLDAIDRRNPFFAGTYPMPTNLVTARPLSEVWLAVIPAKPGYVFELVVRGRSYYVGRKP